MTQTARQYFDEALDFYRNSEFDKALTSFTLGLAIDGNAWEMRMYLGMTCARLGHLREAKKEFLSVRDLCPDPELRRRAGSAVAAMASAQTSSQSIPAIKRSNNS